MEKPDLDPLVRALAAEKLAAMPHMRLRQLRDEVPQALQPYISPFEHRAFAREEVAENPLKAIPLSFLIPLYQAGKLLPGQLGARTPPSLDQLKQGYVGISEGLLK